MDIRKEDLTRFDRIPARKIGLLWLVLRYAFIDHSIALFTEGLGPQKFHGRIVVLVNEHSASASEMVAAFAAENQSGTNRRNGHTRATGRQQALQAPLRILPDSPSRCVRDLAGQAVGRGRN